MLDQALAQAIALSTVSGELISSDGDIHLSIDVNLQIGNHSARKYLVMPLPGYAEVLVGTLASIEEVIAKLLMPMTTERQQNVLAGGLVFESDLEHLSDLEKLRVTTWHQQHLASLKNEEDDVRDEVFSMRRKAEAEAASALRGVAKIAANSVDDISLMSPEELKKYLVTGEM